MQPHAYIFIGRAGAGKGTQAKLLMDVIKEKDATAPILYIETGAEFRKFIERDNYTARMGKQIIDNGGLMPAFMPIFIWAELMVNEYQSVRSVVFDGTPRKLLEAQILESLFPFYGLSKPFIIYLDVEHEESSKRISLRSVSGRKDDNPTAVEKRRLAFEEDVRPTIEWYRTNPNVIFLDVDGERTVEEIHDDIVKRVGLR